MRHFRKELYFPLLFRRQTIDQWLGAGSKMSHEVAHERVQEILAKAGPVPLPASVGRGAGAGAPRCAARNRTLGLAGGTRRGSMDPAPAGKLTMRERVEAVLLGRRLDRLPFLDRLEIWHRCHVRAGTLPAEYAGDP